METLRHDAPYFLKAAGYILAGLTLAALLPLILPLAAAYIMWETFSTR